ncbi:peptide chain release factor N(5)-glutamine methyltransferase [Texcoconibacillus texcoconensis]|uniref:Release factor glutamine methyltransferase n=1 Tax=Texcoconibacillus texcoconensis TaxID=1095777 RepID=A0A840QS13_9BACI|nr:peptide chain release factor N(5)-glutamine methyltransferase [Texcoconibacillus texcoconensis]MBB5174091.1 release factor glutamine methyltransferase [Texcoconibacillus texcoconensis]
MAESVNVYEALNWASSFLSDRSDARQIAMRLLQYETGWSQATLMAEMRSPLLESAWQSFQANIQEVASGRPVQHITGEESFFGRTFHVNEHVLIPRPETEELVQGVIERVQAMGAKRPLDMVDIGTGSGVIAITLALELSQCNVTGTDLSQSALHVAKHNARQLDATVSFRQGDLLTPIKESGHFVDVVVSNPPYIPFAERDDLAVHVKDHEPNQALFAEEDGLRCYRQLAEGLPELLNRTGFIALEIGDGQGKQVQSLFQKAFPDRTVNIENDLNGRERMVFVEPLSQ